MDNPTEILKRLKEKYDTTHFLTTKTPIQTLVAVILSAQCTDARVNKVTKKLFKKYKTVHDFANADLEELEKEIHSTGFYKNKARNIKSASKKIIKDFKGKVPSTMENLIKLRGVARKTANVTLWKAHQKVEGIAVDTHVKRVSYRLGLTDHKNPNKIEQDLTKTYSKKDWPDVSYLIISHGRAICKSQIPNCSKCFLKDLCPRTDVKKSK